MSNCPYCGGIVSKIDSIVIYGISYGDIMHCDDCDAYVGCHKDGKPKGTLANTELRELRKECHALFDPTWRRKRSGKQQRTRTRNYALLATVLNIPVEECHFGMMDSGMCEKAIEIMGGNTKAGGW